MIQIDFLLPGLTEFLFELGVAFTKLFEPWGTRQHAVAALLACLELARRQVIRVEQAGPFGSIFVLRGKRVGSMSIFPTA